MDEIKNAKEENKLNNIPDPNPQSLFYELQNNIYYNCTECSSLIEILSINENNNIIEFKCLSKDNNHGKIIMPIKEYLEKMKKYNKELINKKNCEIHKKNNVSYCFDCFKHLCKDCLRSRVHINHIKNNIIEIEPMDEELKIVKEVIDDYRYKIENLKNEKINKINELENKL